MIIYDSIYWYYLQFMTTMQVFSSETDTFNKSKTKDEFLTTLMSYT